MDITITDDVMDEMEFDENRAEIDPFTLMIIGKVISMVVIYIFEHCIFNKKVANNPGFYDRFRLNRLVHKFGRQEGLDKDKRSRINVALLKKGAKVTEEDINKTLAEVRRIN